LGRAPALLHVYQGWNPQNPSSVSSNSLLNAISSNGSIPVIDWPCPGDGTDGTTADIANNVDNVDNFITAYANQLKDYGKPVFLRWLWEFNLTGSNGYSTCIQQGTQSNPATDGAMYVKAWKTIHGIFSSVGATNVAFVWNPGLAGNTSQTFLSDFWPGSSFVDWIGVDGYSRPTANPPNPYFTTMFGSPSVPGIYQTLTTAPNFAASTTPTIPIMIGETGATNGPSSNGNDFADHQYNYLVGTSGNEGLLQSIPNFPDIKAVNYFDGTNAFSQNPNNGRWTLLPQPFAPGGVESGFSGFAQLAASSYFSFVDPG
jgi:hypothetical protein